MFWGYMPWMGRGRRMWPGRGRGFGFGPWCARGFGPGPWSGRGNPYPWCRFFPWLPRWWWASGYGGPFGPAPFGGPTKQPDVK
jgi:hypothetical protein